MSEKDVMRRGKPVAKIFPETPEAKQRRIIINKINDMDKRLDKLQEMVDKLASKQDWENKLK
jgi:antitoxin (DNA-binding transcriptional repressor) of toxin-antitoxin stability system